MRTIFGVLQKGSTDIDKRAFKETLNQTGKNKPDQAEIWVKDHVAFGQVLITSAEGSEFEELPFFYMETNCCIVNDSRIDYREELVEELDLPKEDIDSISDSELILKTYLLWGKECVEHLFGDFGFAIWDGRVNELFCARDHLGCRPFYYYEDHQVFVFSSRLSFISNLVSGISFDPKYLANVFISKTLLSSESPYINVARLSPAHSLLLDTNGNLSKNRYWELTINKKVSELDQADAILNFKNIFLEAVHQRIKDSSKIGIELSGGLDSSSIAAAITCQINDIQKVQAFSHSLSENQKNNYYPFSDESKLCSSMADFAGIKSVQFVNAEVRDGFIEAISQAMEVTSSPVIQLYPVFSDLLLNKVQTLKIGVLLSGFGGDECATNRAKSIFDEYVIDGRWKDMKNQFHAGLSLRQVLTVLKLFVKYKIPGVLWILKRRQNRSLGRYRKSDLAMAKKINSEILKQEKALRKVNVVKEIRIREQQKQNLLHEHVSERLENSYLLAQERGIEYRYPFLDIKLITFVYSLSADLKHKDGISRYLIRESMKGLIPDEIRLRDNKFGAALPNIYYRILIDSPKIYEIIQEGNRNNKYQYINYKKLARNLEKLHDQNKVSKLSFGPRILISTLSLLILQKWQREGKINIGLKS